MDEAVLAFSLRKPFKASKDNARRVEDAMAAHVAKLKKEIRRLLGLKLHLSLG
jgi:hypothetical protein